MQNSTNLARRFPEKLIIGWRDFRLWIDRIPADPSSFIQFLLIMYVHLSHRIAGQNAGTWSDPHNNGTYSIVDESDPLFYEISRLTGDGRRLISSLMYNTLSITHIVFPSFSFLRAFTVYQISTQILSTLSSYLPVVTNLHPVAKSLPAQKAKSSVSVTSAQIFATSITFTAVRRVAILSANLSSTRKCLASARRLALKNVSLIERM